MRLQPSRVEVEATRTPAAATTELEGEVARDAGAQLDASLAGDVREREKRRHRWVFWLKRTRDLERFGAGLHRFRMLAWMIGITGFPLKHLWWPLSGSRLPIQHHIAWAIFWTVVAATTLRIERKLTQLARHLRGHVARLAIHHGVDLHANADRQRRRKKHMRRHPR